MTLSAKWSSANRKATQPPDPAYPKGIRVDLSDGAVMACMLPLRYPAECCGQWTIQCSTCGYVAIVTAAGRIDDPRSVRVPCKPKRAS